MTMDDSIYLDEEFDFFDDEEDDLLLAEAVEASVAQCDLNATTSGFYEGDDEEIANVSLGVENVTAKEGIKHDSSGFDPSTGQIWIYPTNYPVRDYQYNIVQQALYRNTLVVLPTGLGKTFIAAVVMYNLYRWFPQGKVVFMAPTKPLVAQQINACYNIMGIPKVDTVEMTGNMHPSVREKMWRQKRVIFLTPQVMTNDLSRGSFGATSIKCLVVDEAHKATGNHAYCQVVRELLNFAQDFRVLALSATPGSDLKRVQQVMTNLLISHIELRSEDSIDIRPYTHERKVDKVVVPMGEELSGIRLKYIQIMETVVRRLIQNKVLYNREATKLSKFLILKARDEYRQNPPQNLQGPQAGMIEGDFAMSMSLYHGFELLQLHGLRSLHNFLLGIQSGEKGYGRTRYELARNPDFNDIMEALHEKFASKVLIGKGDEKDQKIVVGHPKMQRLEEIVVEHFKSFQEKNMDTRVMIFSQYRDSVGEIRNILNQHQPLVKVMAFIGQSSVGKSTKGFSQKEQLKVMRQFREGGYNTLVSTCVGEEGLDIGDVDLIVCFDAHKSPIRLVQRMGRTGRKRMGRIVMLVTQGKEEQIYNQSLYSKKSIHKAILNGAKTLHFYPHNPPLIPPGLKPKCHKMFITVKTEAESKASSSKTAKSKEGPKGGAGNQTISNAFSKARSRQSTSELSTSEYEEIRQEFCQISRTAKHMPRPKCLVLSEGTQEDSQCENKSQINLSEWTPWQNRLQQTHLVGHSTSTQHLVQICEFIELQQSIGEEANSYGLEMELYLNKADISKSYSLNQMSKSSSVNQSVSNAPGQSSITSFFTPSQKMKQGNSSLITDSNYSPLFKVSGNDVKLDAKKVCKGKKRLKKKFCKEDENVNSLDKSTLKSVSPLKKSSNLFTILKPVIEMEDDADVEIIDEPVKEMNNETLQNVGNITIRKKTMKKKKLLDAKYSVWNDTILNKSKVCVGKKKKHSRDNLNPNSAEEKKGREIDDEDVDFEVDSLHHMKENISNNPNKSYTVTLPQKQSYGIEKVSSKKIEKNREIDDSDHWDLEEIEDVGQIITPEDCNSVCMIPSPPRVEEVAEMFERMKSPIDFASLDIYKLVDQWKKDEPHLNCLTPTDTSQSDLGKKIFEEKLDLCVNEAVNLDPDIMEEEVEKSRESLKKIDSRILERGESSFLVDTGANFSSKVVYGSGDNVEGNQSSDDDCEVIENDVHVSSFKDDYENSSAAKLQVNDLFESNHKRQSLSNSQMISKCNSHELEKMELSVDVRDGLPSPRIDTKRISPNEHVDSMDEHMQAIDVDNFLFSPPAKTTGKIKSIDTSLKNHSSHSQSFATWSQAFGCLHSSLSETLLSPTNSTFIKSSSGSFLVQEKSPVISPVGMSKSMKTNKASVSSTRKESLHGHVFTSTPTFESTVSKNMNRRDSDNNEEQYDLDPDNITPRKLAKRGIAAVLSESDDEFDSEIIPPTPCKSISGTSMASSQINQSFSSRMRNLHSGSGSSQDHNKHLSKDDFGASIIEPATTKSLESIKLGKSPFGQEENSKGTPLSSTKAISLNRNDAENHPIVNMQGISLLDDYDEDGDCIILTPPPKRKKLPFTSYEKSPKCIEIFDSQSQDGDLFPRKMSPHRNETSAVSNIHPSEKAASNSKKKRLSLKMAGKNNSFEEENQTPKKDAGDAAVFQKAGKGRVSASTPLIKDFQESPKRQAEDDAMFHLTPIVGHLPDKEERDIEESFIIKRRKKATGVLDFSSDNETANKSRWLSSEGKAVKKKPVESSKDESKSLEDWQASYLDSMEDEDDFEGTRPVFSKGKTTKGKTTAAPSRKFKPTKKPKRGANFIEDEAEVSEGDGSSDEHEGGQDDCYEGSFINNDTEMSQADITDMRAVYLKSVKSPVQGRYKLQFDGINNGDIYSQALPDDQGLSEYEEDSFCVGSDEEEDSPVVVKKSKKKKDKNQDRKGKDKMKRRVQMLSGSSSEEENAIPFTQEFTSNQRAIARKALMSSSDDDDDEIGGRNEKNVQNKINAVNDTEYFGDDYLNCDLEESCFIKPVVKNVKKSITEKKTPVFHRMCLLLITHPLSLRQNPTLLRLCQKR